MPSRNTVKQYAAPAYYHVYNRGAGKHEIFRDAQDRQYFMHILQRHLDPKDKSVDRFGVEYRKFDIELVAYCLMRNHFHLMFFQENDPAALTGLMRSVATAYTMYFNKRYKQSGHLFQGVYKASWIADEAYFLHITRYIHLNPRGYRSYKWSSFRQFIGEVEMSWVHPERVLDITSDQYLQFVEDYESLHEERKLLEKSLGL